MRRHSITTFALGAAAGVVTYAALSTGVLVGGVSQLAGAASSLVHLPSAAADELPAFGDCEQLRRWYVRSALPQVGPWGLGGPPVMYARKAMPGVAAPEAGVPVPVQGTAGNADAAVGSSRTGTNVQEAGVDEADVAKTDGRVVVRVSGNELVVTDVSGARAHELSRTTLPGPALAQPELLLDHDRVTLVGTEQPVYYGGPVVDAPAVGRSILPGPRQDTRTHLVSLDISDPVAPRVTASRSIDGSALSTRQYQDGTVRVVLTTGDPPLDFVSPNRDRSPREATRLNRQVVQDAPATAWLPGVRTSSGAKQPLLGCSDVRHPMRSSGSGTISVLTFASGDLAGYHATAVTAAGDLVYSSARRLYVATSIEKTGQLGKVGQVGGQLGTTVHAFALDGRHTSYVGSGSVPGSVKDRWSLSEYDGHLRVVTALGDVWRPRENAVVVLDERGGRLVQTGRVDGLGNGEQIMGVRWFGALAVVVTFRQTDPLYTLDLSDPAEPRVVGTLRVPGFSTYLHPVGGDLLVGVGHDATTTGSELGAQAATFDLRDLSHVRRDDTFGFGYGTSLGAETDPRTFTYLPSQRTIVTPVGSWEPNRSRFVALRVTPDGSLTQTASWSTGQVLGAGARVLPLGGDRVALVDDRVRLVRVG